MGIDYVRDGYVTKKSGKKIGLYKVVDEKGTIFASQMKREKAKKLAWELEQAEWELKKLEIGQAQKEKN